MLFQELIRMYSQNVNTGHSDTDLSKRRRRYLHVLLNLAGNHWEGRIPYATITEDVRKTIIQAMGKDAENVRWFLNPAQESDFDYTTHRAIEILRNI